MKWRYHYLKQLNMMDLAARYRARPRFVLGGLMANMFGIGLEINENLEL